MIEADERLAIETHLELINADELRAFADGLQKRVDDFEEYLRSAPVLRFVTRKDNQPRGRRGNPAALPE